MPKNTPKVNRHPKTGDRLTNPPKVNHKEEKININDTPLLSMEVITRKEREKELLRKNKIKEQQKKEEENIAKDSDKGLAFFIFLCILAGFYGVMPLIGFITLLLSKDLYINKNIKNFLIISSLIEIIITICINMLI